MIKLVVSDLDGTLLDENEVLGPTALGLACWLRERDILFTIATGRVKSMAESYARQLGLGLPYLCCNGGEIVLGNQVLERLRISAAPLWGLVEKACQLGYSVWYSIDGEEYVHGETAWIREQQKTFGRYHAISPLTPDKIQNLFVEKLSIMDGDKDGNMALLEELCKQLPEGYGFTRYQDQSVEVVHANATKARGLLWLADYLGIRPEEILAAGDHQNDIEMIRLAGVGVAVGNATGDLKSEADYTARGCHAEGVREAVERFCSAREARKNA